MSKSRLDRRIVVAHLLQDRSDMAVISGLGAATYDVAAAGDNARNFYLWGAMGGAAMVGLGLALARPSLPVLVVTGDGEMLMGMGAFATIAQHQPGNLSVVVIDNGAYGETGGQASHTSGPTDLAAIAKGAGISDVQRVDSLAEIKAITGRVHRVANAPMVAVVKVAPEEAPRVLPSRDGAFLKGRFQAAVGIRPV